MVMKCKCLIALAQVQVANKLKVSNSKRLKVAITTLHNKGNKAVTTTHHSNNRLNNTLLKAVITASNLKVGKAALVDTVALGMGKALTNNTAQKGGLGGNVGAFPCFMIGV